MVKRSSPEALAAERALAIGYAPADRRAGLATLFALDARLGDILRTTREPMVGQMRLTWWHAALSGLGQDPPRAEPV
jgi:phytoene synthase